MDCPRMSKHYIENEMAAHGAGSIAPAFAVMEQSHRVRFKMRDKFGSGHLIKHLLGIRPRGVSVQPIYTT